MTDKQAQQEYLRRNLIHAKSLGVRAGIESAIKRLVKQKRPPLWLVNQLQSEYAKTEDICTEAAKHRDEVYDKAWKDAF